jgi:hypothetical protein
MEMPEGSQPRAFLLFSHLLFGVRIPYPCLDTNQITWWTEDDALGHSAMIQL